MPSEQDLVNALRQADAQGDTAGAQRIASMIRAQRSAAPSDGAIAGEPDLGGVGNAALAGGLSFVHNLPFVGDAALTAARGVADVRNGQGFDWGRANGEVHQILDSAQQQHPIASTVGAVGGGVDSAVIGGGLAKAAGVGAPLALRAGQPLANAARLAAAGAVGGAAQGGGEQLAGGNVAQALPAAASGAVIGGVAAPALGAAGRVGVGAARRLAAPLSAKTALALSKVFGESASDLQAAWRAHVDATGRPPSMAELANYKQQGAIRGLAKDSTPIASALQGNAEQSALQRSTDMQARFEQGGSASPADLGNIRTQQGDLDYPASRAAPNFNISTAESPELGGVSPADHLASEILPAAGLGRADRVRILEGLKTGTLSGQDAQMIRSGLSDSLNRSFSPATKGYLTDLDSFLHAPQNTASAAPLDAATANFAANSRRVEGAQHGASILGSGSASDFAATASAKPNANPEFTQGMHLGANDTLSAASATPSGATGLAQRLATDNGLYDKLSTTFGQDTADALRRMGQAESASAQALAPHARAPAPEGNDTTLKDAAQVAAAVATHGIGWKAYHAAKVFAGLDMPQAVQTKVAQYLSDPKMAQQGINLLSKAGASAQRLREITLSAAGASGILSGDAASGALRPSAVTIEDVHPSTPEEIAAATRGQ